MLDIHEILSACNGDRQRAARVWFNRWQREQVNRHRISRPWPDEEPTLGQRVTWLEQRLAQDSDTIEHTPQAKKAPSDETLQKKELKPSGKGGISL